MVELDLLLARQYWFRACGRRTEPAPHAVPHTTASAAQPQTSARARLQPSQRALRVHTVICSRWTSSPAPWYTPAIFFQPRKEKNGQNCLVNLCVFPTNCLERQGSYAVLLDCIYSTLQSLVYSIFIRSSHCWSVEINFFSMKMISRNINDHSIN